MKKNVLALSVAALAAGFAGGAHAVLPAAGPAVDATGADATALQFGNTGAGHMLVVPYYTAQNGNMSVLHLSNTDRANGKAVKKVERFRAYDNYGEAFADYARLLSNNNRYAGALNTGSNALAFARGVARGGYATDPAYAEKLASVAQRTSAWMGPSRSRPRSVSA